MLLVKVLTRLAARGGYDITLVSRGSWHFDSAVRVMPHVRLAVCDRTNEEPCEGKTEEECPTNALKRCPDLMRIIKETDRSARSPY